MSAFVLNRNYQLQLPNSFVDVEREEMEYVDWGATKINYWWGYAINLDAAECKAIIPIFKKMLGYAAMATLITSKIKIPYAIALNLACGAATLNMTSTLASLEIAGGRGGATLSKNLSGYWVTIY